MTDYDPYDDFWGDFLTGIVVAIIATRISDKTKDKNDNNDNVNNDNVNNDNDNNDIGIFKTLILKIKEYIVMQNNLSFKQTCKKFLEDMRKSFMVIRENFMIGFYTVALKRFASPK